MRCVNGECKCEPFYFDPAPVPSQVPNDDKKVSSEIRCKTVHDCEKTVICMIGKQYERMVCANV
ncbi:hypothetical protein DCAR_0831852 [Daucus carota subsp. sativus]|uniref:Uncharacterized protein n=1 Tax=Daucus carota subsp. sativus TaxID=79200 RepID=A0A175YMI2_DAUCS|nr:hypothetical protein DCAR_0831852 [Daucus carota subsp. sativus]